MASSFEVSAGKAIGYVSGGAVTQGDASGKATAVTLNQPCGQITMDDAALAAAAEVTFTVTNSEVAATDVVVASIASGGTSGAYTLTVGAVAAGSFDLSLGNVGATSLSEAVVINYAVIKASAS